MLGPVFQREVITTPRRPKHYLYRALYVTALLVLMATAWLVVAGTQSIRNIGDLARFGALIFRVLVPLQLALVTFLSALGCAAAVAQEKDKRTLILLLLTRMSNAELVLGKLSASLLNVMTMLLAALPLFMFVTVFGGVSHSQVARCYAITIVSALAAGSIGCMLALWREKTFQALALTGLTLVIWLGFWEGVVAAQPFLPASLSGIGPIAGVASPFRAMLVALDPNLAGQGWWDPTTLGFVVAGLSITVVVNLTAIWRVRIWNPSREVRRGHVSHESQASVWGEHHDIAQATAEQIQEQAEASRQQHVDARTRTSGGESRRVWDNPVLWREVCTWAYGRKVILIRVVYLVLAVLTGVGLYWSTQANPYALDPNQLADIIPAAAKPLAPFLLLSLVLVNALAVTSITNERDGQAIDLLLVTDISPREFVFGKLWGVLWVTKEMVLAPLALIVYLWIIGGVGFESMLFVLIGLLVMNAFVAMLGIHYGMNFPNSRSAVLVSLGTVFFLFLGVVTCMLMMISFSGSFENQLPPFLAFIMGGGVGLYVALGHRNPSGAIAVASLLLPFATFFAITSFLLRDHELTVFLVISVAYGFTTAAMLVPAVYEFDFAMGRTKVRATISRAHVTKLQVEKNEIGLSLFR